MATFDDTYYSITFNASGQDFFAFAPILINSTVTSVSSVNASAIAIRPIPSTTVTPLSAVNATVIARRVLPSTTVTSNTSVNLSLSAVSAAAAVSAGRFKALISNLEIFRSGVLQDTAGLKPFFSIDGVPLTEQNRKYSSSMKTLRTVNTRWNNRSGVYYKTQNNKNTFVLQWTYVPSKRENTIDLFESRNFLKEKVSDPSSHTLTIRNIDANGLTKNTATTYNVVILDYSETLRRRDINQDEYYWDFSVTLQEV